MLVPSNGESSAWGRTMLPSPRCELADTVDTSVGMRLGIERHRPAGLLARFGREALMAPSRLASLEPASRIEAPPRSCTAELEREAHSSYRIIGQAVLRQEHAHLIRTFKLRRLADYPRRQRSGVLQSNELGSRPDRGPGQIGMVR